jgi:AcrR family transcriptional regulator
MNRKAAPQETSVANKAKARQRNTLGKASRDQIIASAERLLRVDGYHMLSTRKVADACGISVGNLTYHFPNKTLLIEAVITAVCLRYQSQRPSIVPAGDKTPRQYLSEVSRWMLKDAIAPDTSALFLELWVLAKHHRFATEALEQLYETVTCWITDSLESYFPKSSLLQRQRAAYFLLSLSEGSVAVFSRPHQRPVEPDDLVELAVAAALSCLHESSSP